MKGNPRFFSTRPSQSRPVEVPTQVEANSCERIGRLDNVPILDRPEGERITIEVLDEKGEPTGETYDAILLGRDPSQTPWVGKPIGVMKGVTRIETRRLLPNERIRTPSPVV